MLSELVKIDTRFIQSGRCACLHPSKLKTQFSDEMKNNDVDTEESEKSTENDDNKSNLETIIEVLEEEGNLELDESKSDLLSDSDEIPD